MRNFRGEIGRKIRYKMLSFKRIGFYFKMTNENVRFFSPFFQLQKYIYFLNLQFFLQRFFFFYILSYQSDSLASTKNHFFITNR